MEELSDAELKNKFEEDCEIRGFSKHTIEGYISSSNLFSDFLRKRNYTLLTIDRKILREYISYLRHKEIRYKTIKNRFSALSSLYDYAVYEGFMERNIINDVRKRYLRVYKENNGDEIKRKLVTIEEMSRFVNSIIDIRDKAIALLLAKTGIRRRELVAIELDDINWDRMRITLKPTPKRSNRVIFYDYECAMVLKRWLKKRELIADPECKALFVSYIDRKEGVNSNGVYCVFIKWAKHVGLYNSNSDKIEDRFTPHCCRHWFTTYLRKAGMPREFIQELRGDKRSEAIDIYDHIDKDELQKSYLACIPQLGI